MVRRTLDSVRNVNQYRAYKHLYMGKSKPPRTLNVLIWKTEAWLICLWGNRGSCVWLLRGKNPQTSITRQNLLGNRGSWIHATSGKKTITHLQMFYTQLKPVFVLLGPFHSFSFALNNFKSSSLSCLYGRVNRSIVWHLNTRMFSSHNLHCWIWAGAISIGLLVNMMIDWFGKYHPGTTGFGYLLRFQSTFVLV